MRPVRSARWLAVATLVLSAACFGDDPTGNATATGTYTLRSVNGSALPFTVTGRDSVILDGTITLYVGFTYAETGHTRSTVNGQTVTHTISETGTYSYYGNSISLRSNATQASKLAVYQTGRMTFIDAGLTAVYTK